MIVLLVAAVSSFFALFGAGSSDFVCKHQEWTAKHMNGELGWSLEKGRKVAAGECRAALHEDPKAQRVYWAE